MRFTGEIIADEEACASFGVDTGRISRTIDTLGLNVERLRLAREKRWRALSENWHQHYNDPEIMTEAARMELLPETNGKLQRFFTTSRSYFAPLGEYILSQSLQEWI